MSCLALSMCEITNLLYQFAGVNESTVALSFFALFFNNSLKVFYFKCVELIQKVSTNCVIFLQKK